MERNFLLFIYNLQSPADVTAVVSESVKLV